MGGKRILVVDDEPFLLRFVQEILKQDGHNLTLAGAGLEALQLFSPGKFDLIIIDLLMPGMRGDELARRIKEIAPSQPVILMTGLALEGLIGQLKFDAALEKPFSLVQLRAAIAKVLP